MQHNQKSTLPINARHHHIAFIKTKMSQTETVAEPEDPVESMLKKTGCINIHYKVQVRMKSVFPSTFKYKHFRAFSFSFLSWSSCRSALQRHKIGVSVKVWWQILRLVWQNTANNNERSTNKLKAVRKHINQI